MSATRVLYISQEISPYLPETELSTTSRYLPQAIQEKGKEIRTFMPKFGSINERRNQLHEVIRLSGMNLIIDDTDHPLIIKVASIQSARMQVYFIDNEDYFQRKNTVMDDNQKEYPDNDERSIFYVRGVLETVKKLKWVPDIIHCQGWMTALTPLYIKKAYAEDPCFRNSKIIYSLYNDEFQSPFNENFREKLLLSGVSEEHLQSIKDEISHATISKLAVDFSDGIIQSSEKVNESVIQYAQSKNKPVLNYSPIENNIDAYNEFYDSIWDNESTGI